MNDEKSVVYIRHNFKNFDAFLGKAWNKHLIFIHYDNTKSLDYNDYSDDNKPAVKKAIEIMSECSRKGAIVVADYRKIKKNCLLLGEIKKGTKIKPIEHIENNSQYIFKSMQLENVREINFIDYPIMGAVPLRQVTIGKIKKMAETVKHLFYEKELSDKVSSLSPEQLEVLCYEYLIEKGMLKSLLLPIGRNLIDTDIVGIDSNGNKISAQVTFAEDYKKVINKLENLRASIPPDDRSTKLLFFAPLNNHIEKNRDKFSDIKIIDIEKEVYDFMKSTERGKLLIENILNRKL